MMQTIKKHQKQLLIGAGVIAAFLLLKKRGQSLPKTKLDQATANLYQTAKAMNGMGSLE